LGQISHYPVPSKSQIYLVFLQKMTSIDIV